MIRLQFHQYQVIPFVGEALSQILLSYIMVKYYFRNNVLLFRHYCYLNMFKLFFWPINVLLLLLNNYSIYCNLCFANTSFGLKYFNCLNYFHFFNLQC